MSAHPEQQVIRSFPCGQPVQVGLDKFGDVQAAPRLSRLPSVDPNAATPIIQISCDPLRHLTRTQAHRQRQQHADRQRVLRLFEVGDGRTGKNAALPQFAAAACRF